METQKGPPLLQPKEGKANAGVPFLPSTTSWVVQTQQCQILLTGAWEKGERLQTQIATMEIVTEHTKKTKSQISWSHDGEGTSEATNLHPCLEKVRARPHLIPSNLTQSECWEGTAIIPALLIRLFVGTRLEPAWTTACSTQRRRVQSKPWHRS